MVTRHLMFMLIWTCFTRGTPMGYRKVQFIPAATSFTRRTDQYAPNFKVPRPSRLRIDVNDLVSVDLSSVQPYVTTWNPEPALFHHSSAIRYHSTSHVIPEFHNVLSHTDPFLRTGIEALRKATYLYSKELFFHNIPHVRAVLYNQQERRKNGLPPHKLGSLRLDSPWYRYRDVERIGRLNRVIRY